MFFFLFFKFFQIRETFLAVILKMSIYTYRRIRSPELYIWEALIFQRIFTYLFIHLFARPNHATRMNPDELYERGETINAY